MKVTIFKNIRETSTPFIKDVEYIFKRIKEGNSKELILKIRKEKNKEERNKLKSNLPSICFSGVFKNRSINGLIEHSGLICLDFDNYTSIEEMNVDRAKLIKDKYTFSLFTSPSGLGLKLIVKIPNENENHKLYFDALEKHYNNKNFDSNVSDVSRVCYESIDENIYINNNSKIWNTKEENISFSYENKAPVIKLENENEIIKRLFVWFDKNIGFSSGSRNASLFKLAASFSDFGVSKIEAIRFCNKYEQQDFTIKEIENVVNSAYKKGSANFGMKYFEDEIKLKEIKQQFKTGKTPIEVAASNPSIDKDSINSISENININNFWTFTKKGVSINHLDFKLWLQSNGFYKYYPVGAENFIFIKVENNLIDTTNEDVIKDFVLKYMLDNSELLVYQHLAGTNKLFKEDYLNLLDPIKISFKEDTENEAYLYFSNGVVKVTSKGVEMIDYLDLDGFVWKKHVIDFEIKPTDNIDCDFKKFIYLVSDKDEKREVSLATTLGYLMHSYKTSANNKAVILNDETISENPNGGSGKGIFWNAISKIKRTVGIDGKSFSFDKSFPYQIVSADTQLLVFDDVQKNFKFENLFSIVTEGIILEKKNKDAIKISVHKSPKILITTNYTIGGVGGSFERRKWELEFSAYFNSKHTPLKEFGRMLFENYSYDEWLSFYNYMIRCIQLYLINGLVDTDFKNLNVRKFIKETCFEFYEFTKETPLKVNERIDKSIVYNQFLEEYPDWAKYKLSQKRFWSWVEKYADFNNLTYKKGQDSMGQRYIELLDK